MKNCVKLLPLLLLAALLAGCGGDEDSTNNLQISAACENEQIMYAVIDIDITLSGELEWMESYGGEGTVSGRLAYRAYDEIAWTNYDISGTWENGRTGSNDRKVSLDLQSSDGSLSLSSTTYYEFASTVTSEDLIYGSFTLDSASGSWHSCLAGYSDLDVESAVRIDTDDTFLDMTCIEGDLYCVVENTDGSRSVVSLDPSDGSTAEVSCSCAYPAAIAWDGSDTWLAGNENAEDSGYRLYKYNGATLGLVEDGYPASSADTLPGAISYNGSALYYHNNSTLMSAIGSINTTDGTLTPLLYEEFSSPVNLARTEMLAAVSGGYYTCYYAAGGEWCDLRKVDADGDLLKKMYCPENLTGPIAVNGDTLYLIQGGPNRLYVINM